MQLTVGNIAIFLSLFILYIGVLKIYFPKNATTLDLFELQKIENGKKISFSQIINKDIEGVNDAFVSKYKTIDSVLAGNTKMIEDFFNIILIIALPISILLTAIFLHPSHKYILGVIGFLEALMALNRYSTFDAFSKNVEDLGYSSAVSILKSNQYILSNLSISTNFLIFPLMQLSLIYFAMFV